MSAVITDQSFLSGVPAGGALSIPLTGDARCLTLSFGVKDSFYQIEAILTEAPVILNDRFIAEFYVDSDVTLVLTFVGERSEDETQFLSGQFSLNYNITNSRPRAHFVASTLMAICGLAGKIQIPELVKTDLNLDVPLPEISELLWRRQLAYRLMLIERAAGIELLLPPAISERDRKTITFVYNAIAEHSFTWVGGSLKASIPATQISADSFTELGHPFKWSLRVGPLREIVLGQSIDLGHATVTIEDAVVQNLDEIREQIEANDGREVNVEIRSLSGQDKYEFTELPYSFGLPWEPKIQTLVDLEPHLDAAITKRYHALAAATLEGLTEEEKAAVTARPELDEEAFNTES